MMVEIKLKNELWTQLRQLLDSVFILREKQ